MRAKHGAVVCCVTTLLAAAAPAALAAGSTERVSVSSGGEPANGDSELPSISGDGRLLAFRSDATNLAPDAGTPGQANLYVRDRHTGTTVLASVTPAGGAPNADSPFGLISRDGRSLAFFSFASNLLSGGNRPGGVFLRDLGTGTTTLVSVSNRGRQANGVNNLQAISADGHYVAFTSDATNLSRIAPYRVETLYVRDTRRGVTELAARASDGEVAQGFVDQASLSGNGRFVVFDCNAPNLVPGVTEGHFNLFLRDQRAGTTRLVSVATDGKPSNSLVRDPFVSDDGRLVAFDSTASNLVPSDHDNSRGQAYVRDVKAGTTERVSVATDGGRANDDVFVNGLSADGRYVLLVSQATNLVPGVTIGGQQVYVRDRLKGTTVLASVSNAGVPGNGGSAFTGAAISAAGRTVTFDSDATNLVPHDTGDHIDVFVRVLGP
jgi:Tol biopolymer transport system component